VGFDHLGVSGTWVVAVVRFWDAPDVAPGASLELVQADALAG
jgi:hypothetical protein